MRRRHGVQDEDRERDPGVAQLQRLVEGRDGEAIRAGGLEGERDRDGAMPVRVGLDDGFHADARPRDRAQRREVAAQRVEVELQPRGARQRGEARRRRRASMGSRGATGDRRDAGRRSALNLAGRGVGARTGTGGGR